MKKSLSLMDVSGESGWQSAIRTVKGRRTGPGSSRTSATDAVPVKNRYSVLVPADTLAATTAKQKRRKSKPKTDQSEVTGTAATEAVSTGKSTAGSSSATERKRTSISGSSVKTNILTGGGEIRRTMSVSESCSGSKPAITSRRTAAATKTSTVNHSSDSISNGNVPKRKDAPVSNGEEPVPVKKKQENLKEKDQLIAAKTQAITLMTADLSKKGRKTLDQLDDTREQMRDMQQLFLSMESQWNEQKEKLEQELQSKRKRVEMLEDGSRKAESLRFELNARNAELQEKVVRLREQMRQNEGSSKALNTLNQELNKELLVNKHKMQVMEKTIQQLKSKDQTTKGSPDQLQSLEQRIVELEEEKGNLQLRIMDMEESQSSEQSWRERVGELEEKLSRYNQDLDMQLKMITVLETEKLDLMEVATQKDKGLSEAEAKLGQAEDTRVRLEMKLVEVEEQRDTAEKKSAEIQEDLTTLKEEIANDEKRIEREDLQEELMLAKVNISNLHETLRDKEEECKQAISNLESFEAQWKESEQTLKNHHVIVSELNGDLEKLHNELERTKQQLEEASRNLENKQIEIKEEEEKHQQAADEVERLSNQVRKLEEECRVKDVSYKELHDDCNNIYSSLKDTEKVHMEVYNSWTESVEQYNAVCVTLEEAKNKHSLELEEWEKQRTENCEKLLATETKLEELKFLRQELQDKVTITESELSQTKEQLREAKCNLDDKEEKMEKLNDELQQMYNRVNAVDQEMHQKELALKEFEVGQEDMKRHLQEKEVYHQECISQAEERMQTKDQELAKCLAQLHGARALVEAKIEEVTAAQEEGAEQNRQLRQQVEEAERLRLRLSDVEALLNTKNMEISDTSSQFTDLQTLLEGKSEEINVLNGAINQKITEFESLNETTKQYEVEIKTIRDEILVRDSRIEELLRELSFHKERLEEVAGESSKKSEENKKLALELTEKENIFKDLTEEVSDKNTSLVNTMEELMAIKSQFDEVVDERQKLEARALEETERWQKAVSEKDETIQELRNALDSQQQLETGHQADLKVWEDALMERDVVIAELKAAERKQKELTVEEEVKRGEAEERAVRAQEKVEELMDSVTKLTAEGSDLGDVMRKKDEAIDQLKVELQQVHQQMVKLERDLEKLQEEVEVKQDEVLTLQEQVEFCNDCVEGKEQRCNQLQSQLDELLKDKAALKEAKAEIEELKKRLESSGDEDRRRIADLMSQLSQAENRVNDVQVQLTQQQEMSSELQTEVNDGNTLHEQARTQVAELNAEIQSTHEELAARQRKIDDLNSIIEDLSTEKRNLAETIQEQAKIRMTALEAEVETVRDELEAKREEIADLSKTIGELSTEKENLSEQIRVLNEQDIQARECLSQWQMYAQSQEQRAQETELKLQEIEQKGDNYRQESERKVKELEDQNCSLNKEIEAKLLENESETTERETYLREVNRLEKDLLESKNILNILKELLQIPSHEEIAETVASLKQESSDLREGIENARLEITELQEKLEAQIQLEQEFRMKEVRAQEYIGDLEGKVQEMSSSLEKERLLLTQTSDSKEKEVMQKLYSLEKNNSNYEARLREKDDEIESLFKIQAEMQQELSESEETHASQLETYTKELQELTQELVGQSSENKKLSEMMKENEGRIEQFEALVQQLHSELEERGKNLEELRKMRDGIESTHKSQLDENNTAWQQRDDAWRDAYTALQMELSSAVEERTALVGKLQIMESSTPTGQLEQALIKSQDDMRALNAALVDRESQIEELKGRYSSEREYSSSPMSEVAEVQQRSSTATPTYDLEQLTKENVALKEEIQSAKIKSGKMLHKMKQMKDANTQLKKQLDGLKSKSDDDLDMAMEAELNEQRKLADKKVQEADKMMEAFNQEKIRLHERLETLENANDKYLELKEQQDATVDKLVKERKTLLDNCQALEWKLAETEEEKSEEISELKKEIESTQRELQSIRLVGSSCGEGTAIAEDMDLIAQEITSLKKMIADLDSEKTELQKGKNLLQEEMQVLENNSKALQTIADEAKATKDVIERENRLLRQQSQNSVVLEDEILQFKADLEKTEQEYWKVSKELQSLQYEYSSMEQKMLDSQANCNIISTKCIALEEQAKELEKVKAEVNLLALAKQELQDEVVSLQGKLKAVNYENEKFQQLLEARDADNEKLRQDMMQAENLRLKNLQEDYFLLDKEVRELRDGRLMLLQEIDSAGIREAEAKEKLANRERDLAALVDKLEGQQKENVKLKEEHIEYINVSHELERETQRVTTDLNAAIQEKLNLREQLEDKVATCTELQDQLKNLQQQRLGEEQQSDEVTELRKCAVALKTELDWLKLQYEARLAKMHSEIDKLEKENISLKKQVDNWKTHLSEMSKLKNEPSNGDLGAELEKTMRVLHQRELRCEELTLETSRLLEERDSLQLKLSSALRLNQELDRNLSRQRPDSPPLQTTSSIPTYLPQDPNILTEKLEELQRLYEGGALPPLVDLLAGRDADGVPLLPLLPETNTTLTRDVQSPIQVLLNWLSGRSPPRVLHV